MGSGRKNCLKEKDVDSAVPFETIAMLGPRCTERRSGTLLSHRLESMCTISGTM